jgi:ABC-type nitrate/sulfonate/bicarbonate transport system substrate-binding protein
MFVPRLTPLTVAMAILVTACGSASPASPAPPSAPAVSAAAKPAAPSPAASGGALTKVRYGLSTSPPAITTVGSHWALDNGFFKDEGLDVEITPYVSLASVRALLSRDTDIISTGPDNFLQAYVNGAPLTVIGGPMTKSPDSFVAGSGMASLKDLAGKKIAISAPNGPQHNQTRVLAQRNGVDINKIEFVSVGSPPDRAKALLADKVDATIMTILVLQPILEAVDKGQLKVLTTMAKEFPDVPLAWEITRPDLVKSQPQVLTKFLKAQLKGYRWAVQQPDAAAIIAAKYVKEVDHALMVRGIKSMIDLDVYGLDGGISLDSIGRTEKGLLETGVITKDVKPEEITNIGLLQAAVKELGPARK